MVEGMGFKVYDSRVKDWGLGFRVQGSAFGGKGLGCAWRVYGSFGFRV